MAKTRLDSALQAIGTIIGIAILIVVGYLIIKRLAG